MIEQDIVTVLIYILGALIAIWIAIFSIWKELHSIWKDGIREERQLLIDEELINRIADELIKKLKEEKK